MSSIDPSLISDPKEHTWIVEIDEIINHQLDIDTETLPVSLFHVPETITSKKPEAHEPQQIGLGPIHHFRPFPYKKMEQKKAAVVRKVLKDYDIVKDYKPHVLDKVRKFVPMVRSCYDMFLQDDDESLARVFAIDGLFLLNLFHAYNARMDEYLLHLKTIADKTKHTIDSYVSQLREFDVYKEELEFVLKETDPLLRQEEIVVTAENQDKWENVLHVTHHQPELPEVGPKKRLVAQDVLMVENQIPFIVLQEINESLKSASSGNSSHSTVNLSPFVFRVFCEIHSPLKLCLKSQAPSSVDHLLHYMYYSIVNNVPKQQRQEAAVVASDEMKKPDVDKDDQRHDYPEDREGDFEPVIYKFISKFPRKEAVQLYEHTISMLEAFAHISKPLVPSATILHDEAGFQFHSLEENEGIRNIQVEGKDIHLPIITLNNDSEVILRNLVAYETLTASADSSFPLNEYMGLMCGLIANKDDVNYLKAQDVITGDMPEDEVVKLFAGISSVIPTVETKEKSQLRGVIDEINKVYESGVKMKTYLLLQKLARWLLVLLKAIGTSVESSWKVVAFMVSIVTVFLLTYQAYCDSFGCDKKTVTILPYASS